MATWHLASWLWNVICAGKSRHRDDWEAGRTSENRQFSRFFRLISIQCLKVTGIGIGQYPYSGYPFDAVPCAFNAVRPAHIQPRLADAVSFHEFKRLS